MAITNGFNNKFPLLNITGAISLGVPLSVTNGGSGVTTSTGSGNLVLSTSPTFVTPLLGTPTSGVLTNCTGITTSGINASAVTYAKIQNVTAATLLGNPTGSGSAPSEITLGTNLSFSGSVLNATGGGGSGTVTSITAGTGLSGGTITTSGTISLTAPVTFALGGTNNAALTANNGGIVYSDASKLNILAGTATANLPLLSGSSTAPTWGSFAISLGGALTTAAAFTQSGAFATTITSTAISNATLPSGTTTLVPTTGTGATGTWGINISGTSATVTTNANLTGPITSSGNATTITANSVTTTTINANAVTYAKLQSETASTLLGNPTGSGAVPSEITLGTNLSFSGSVLNATGGGGGSTYVNQTTSTATLATAHTYGTNDGATLVTYILPTTAALGDTFTVLGFSSGGWKIAQNASQQIQFGSSNSTSGTGGFIASTLASDCATLICITANTLFAVFPAQGNLTVS